MCAAKVNVDLGKVYVLPEAALKNPFAKISASSQYACVVLEKTIDNTVVLAVVDTFVLDEIQLDVFERKAKTWYERFSSEYVKGRVNAYKCAMADIALGPGYVKSELTIIDAITQSWDKTPEDVLATEDLRRLRQVHTARLNQKSEKEIEELLSEWRRKTIARARKEAKPFLKDLYFGAILRSDSALKKCQGQLADDFLNLIESDVMEKYANVYEELAKEESQFKRNLAHIVANIMVDKNEEPISPPSVPAAEIPSSQIPSAQGSVHHTKIVTSNEVKALKSQPEIKDWRWDKQEIKDGTMRPPIHLCDNRPCKQKALLLGQESNVEETCMLRVSPEKALKVGVMVPSDARLWIHNDDPKPRWLVEIADLKEAEKLYKAGGSEAISDLRIGNGEYVCPVPNGLRRMYACRLPRCGEVFSARETRNKHEKKEDVQNVVHFTMTKWWQEIREENFEAPMAKIEEPTRDLPPGVLQLVDAVSSHKTIFPKKRVVQTTDRRTRSRSCKQ